MAFLLAYRNFQDLPSVDETTFQMSPPLLNDMPLITMINTFREERIPNKASGTTQSRIRHAEMVREVRRVASQRTNDLLRLRTKGK